MSDSGTIDPQIFYSDDESGFPCSYTPTQHVSEAEEPAPSSNKFSKKKSEKKNAIAVADFVQDALDIFKAWVATSNEKTDYAPIQGRIDEHGKFDRLFDTTMYAAIPQPGTADAKPYGRDLLTVWKLFECSQPADLVKVGLYGLKKDDNGQVQRINLYDEERKQGEQ